MIKHQEMVDTGLSVIDFSSRFSTVVLLVMINVCFYCASFKFAEQDVLFLLDIQFNVT